MNAVAKLAFAAENERLLEKVREAGADVRSFEGWKAAGLFVKRGEKQKAFRVKSGTVAVGIDPITGADDVRTVFKTAYGFTRSQVG